ncbi:hypothetical protein [Paenibacillus bovis]|uniref:Uncharacterized protein n=1 Tax=Paenibacillus bovis TaxID=1616788 RepID=A0A1X9T414_9BACL|nr:hypothetical protein [Paenibacillus bovis]ARR10710.1 hypothetical protein AR543_p0102 [Paenibacillus bovis]
MTLTLTEKVTLTNLELNKLAAEQLDYIFEVPDSLDRVIIIRADGQPSEFNPCKYAAQTTELVHKALSQCETRFRVQLLTLVSGYELPMDYRDLIHFCRPHTRKITLAAVVALQEFEKSKNQKKLKGKSS